MGMVVRTNTMTNFSYSERWRYIGSVKPGNPCFQEGANLSEQSNNKGFDKRFYQVRLCGLFLCHFYFWEISAPAIC